MKIKRFKIFLLAGIMMITCGMTACNGRDNNVVTGQYYHPAQDEAPKESEDAADGESETESTEENAESGDVFGADAFIITQNDMQAECLVLEQIISGKQYMYNYSLSTQFLDKYGNRATVSDFEPGRVMTVNEKDRQGRLLQAQLSDKVWEYPDVTRFTVDEERGVFMIADTNYSYDNNLYVHLDGQRQFLSELSELDTLRVVGVDNKILTISVTTGHGTLQLQNTEIFEGSFIQIGEKIFSEITRDMEMEIPAGTYTVAVANNGYGGSKEITIEGGKELVLDLDELKGEGPKFGNILFAVDVEGAILQIDGKTVDYREAVPVQYGLHTLTVTASSYDTYSKKLYVNSERATIVIGLTGEGTPTVSDTTNESNQEEDDSSKTSNATTPGDTAGSLAGSAAGSMVGGQGTDSATGGTNANVTSATSEAELDAIVDSILDADGDGEDDSTSDYLSTLTELLSSLAGTSDDTNE